MSGNGYSLDRDFLTSPRTQSLASYDIQDCADFARQWMPKTDVDGRTMALRNAAIELTEYARLLEVDVAFKMQKNMTRYPILTDDCGLRVWRITGGNCIQLKDRPRMNGGSSFGFGSSSNWWYGQREYDVSVPGYVTITPAPAADGDPVEMKLWMAVRYDASTLPALLWDESRMALQEGTIYHLLNMVGAEWSDSREAYRRRKEWDRQLSMCRTKAEKRHSTEFQTISPPRII